MRSRTLRLFAALAMALCLSVAAGCGGSGSSSDATADTGNADNGDAAISGAAQ
jgi:hypothetical protein